MEQNNHEWYSPKGVYDWYAPNFPAEKSAAEPAIEEETVPHTDPTPVENSAAAPERKPRKKRTGMKVTMIIICVLILIAATAFAFSDGVKVLPDFNFDYSISGPGFDISNGGDEKTEDDDSSTQTDIPEDFFNNIPGFPEIIPETELPSDSDGNGMPDNFSDFFNNYFTNEETIEPSLMEKVDASGLVLELKSSEGLEKLTLQQLYSRVSPSIVGVMPYIESAGGYGWASGVIVDAEGYIITNAHVLSGASKCTVYLFNGRECEALLVGEDSETDLAVLKINAKGLVPATLGTSDELSVGDEVCAIGNPLGPEFTGTLTNGIVSALNRPSEYSGTDLTLIQTNTAMNNGSSGGALINMYGQVVGITNMKMMSGYGSTIEGIGFAIPSTIVKDICDSLIAEGKVSGRPGIGIVCGSVPPQAMTEYGLPEGLYITEVSEGSDAKEKGILPGDVLTHINGIAVLTTDDVIRIRDDHEIGDELLFTIYRDGETFTVPVEIYDQNDLF